MYNPITGTGTGAAPVVSLTWPFISKDHVKATVNGVAAALTWTGAAQVTFSSVVPGGAAWSVYRQTPIDSPIVDFTDGAVLTEANLDLANLQHLYADQELSAQFTALGAVGKGDPGGNVLAIGTYATATGGALTIAGGTNVVQTSGYAVDGDGGDARFAATDSVTYAAFTGPKFTAGIRYFILAMKMPNSYVFGVGLSGNSASTNRSRLQAFFDHIAAVRYELPALVGDFTIDAGVSLVLGHINTGNLMWTAKVTASGTFNVLLDITTTSGEWSHIHGKVHLNGGNQTAYASRTIQTAVTFSGTGRLIVDSWDLRYFKHTGLYSVQGTNNNLLSMGKVYGAFIGSGAPGADTTLRLTANWSTRVDTGTDENINQLTTLTVDALPDAYAETHPSPILVLLNGLTHVVSSIDRVNSKITIESWPDPAVTSGVLTYLIGTVTSLEGSDANVISIDTLDVSTVSNAVISSGLYGPYIGRLLATLVGSAVMVGGATGDAHDGLTIGDLYIESGSTKSIIRVTRAVAKVNILNVQAVGGDPSLIDIPGAPWSVGNASRLSTFNNLDTFIVRGTYGFHAFWKQAVAPFGTTINLYLDRPARRHELYHLDSRTIALQTPDDKLRRYFGYNANTLTFVGTGTSGAPTGAFTFTPPTGHKINGGSVNASAVLSGYKGPVTFAVKYDGLIDWVVYAIGGTVRGAAVTDPSAMTYVAATGGATVDTQARASQAQLAADVTSTRTQLAALLASLRAGGGIS